MRNLEVILLDINECKFLRNYRHGGSLFINTQNIQNKHYIIKRVLEKYFYIHPKIHLQFISILKIREFLYYDSICYSILTDDLKFYKKYLNKIKSRKDIKTKNILKNKGIKKKKINKNNELKKLQQEINALELSLKEKKMAYTVLEALVENEDNNKKEK